jgi:hypothetical protein
MRASSTTSSLRAFSVSALLRMACHGGGRFAARTLIHFARVRARAHRLTTFAPRAPTPHLGRSRFTPWNFLPLFLLDAFQRLANFYFLVVCILQSIPEVSITNGVPTSFLPLGVVLLFDGFATAREDYKRHVDDDKANNSKSARCPRPSLRQIWTLSSPRTLPETTSLLRAQRSPCATAPLWKSHGQSSKWATL